MLEEVEERGEGEEAKKRSLTTKEEREEVVEEGEVEEEVEESTETLFANEFLLSVLVLCF